MSRRGTDPGPVRRRIAAIRPHDVAEHAARGAALAWVDSGAPLFRVQRPDLPFRRLLSSVVLLDDRAYPVLLVRHNRTRFGFRPSRTSIR